MQAEKRHGREWVRRLVTYWCGWCDMFEDYEGIGVVDCRKNARLDGWRLTEDAGWLCPECAADPSRRRRSNHT